MVIRISRFSEWLALHYVPSMEVQTGRNEDFTNTHPILRYSDFCEVESVNTKSRSVVSMKYGRMARWQGIGRSLRITTDPL